ncbi:MAG: hypothetical protein JWP12_480 [Bacteroidetes bacterium]|nr:hypothetical protein [Bacteroidota bacterium]
MRSLAKLIVPLFILGTISSFGQNTLRTNGDRKYYDSAQYSIILGKYISGEKYIACYQNKLTKLDSWKEYYENGQLKEDGLMTNGNDIYVGTWKYYSSSGKTDSIVNYDTKYPISYFKAVKIAETKGFKMPDMEVTETCDITGNYWDITRWTENKEHSGQNAEFILINKITGEVIKPTNIIKSSVY